MAPAIVVMGVMAAGKTTLAQKLAAALALPFIEGDDLHAPESRVKLAAGAPLMDEDRWPWLARVGEALRKGGVAACSALTYRYRDAIRAAAGRDVLFVFLDTPREALLRRVAMRPGHFASPTLLDSQIALLEPPGANEQAITIDPDTPLADIVARCRLEKEGRTWFRAGLDETVLRALDAACNVGEAPGRRLALEPPAALDALACTLLPGARPVRVVAFDKNQTNNWTLPWHQDRVVALRERIEAPGFSNWTNKAGVWHAEPPIRLLERMLFARIHLDPADTLNGCLQLALGTHQNGTIASVEASAVVNAATIEDCLAARGDVLFAKALILHRSSPSKASVGRRAVRIDYCAEDLPHPLKWAA